LPFAPVLAFAFKDGSFVGNLEQCNGCGGCRKDAPTMCPTFLATGDEIMSTRGRANIIRAALQLRVNGHDPLRSAELDAALSNCLSCKGCTPECPSNVNLALLKAELMYARHRRDGLPLRERILSNVDLLGRLGCITPSFANSTLRFGPLRLLMEKILGLSAKRSLPRYASERFDRWFARRKVGTSRCDVSRTAGQRSVPTRGKVILWDDTFVRYHEPRIGIAAVKVLEALGFEVSLAKNRRCCGRPAFSQGNLDAAAKLGKHNVDLLNCNTGVSPAGAPHNQAGRLSYDIPIIFLEPSCYSMFVEDYRELKIENAGIVAKRCFLFEKFVGEILDGEPSALHFNSKSQNVAIHAHCHAKSLMNLEFMVNLAERLPGRKATLLDTGCCGMAGAFGALAEKYELSLKVAEPLVQKVNHQSPGSEIVASGTSCRHQIVDLTTANPKHMAEVIAEAIV